MAIGIQGAGVASQGIDPQGVTTQAVDQAPLTVTSSEIPQNNNHADNWLKQDLDNPFIVPWGEFDVDPNARFDLASAYGGGKPANNAFGNTNFHFMGGRPQGIQTTYGNTGANDLFGNLAQNSFRPQLQSAIGFYGNADRRSPAEIEAARLQPFKDAYTGATNKINFRDKNLDAAIDALNDRAQSYLMPKYSSHEVGGNGAFGNIGGFGKPKPVADTMLANSYGWAPVSRLTDGSARDKMFGEVASQYGIRLDDLQNKYGQYDKAFRSINDPVGANWQDLKSSPIYKNLIGDIRQYSEDSTGSWGKRGRWTPGSTNAAYFDRMNAMVPDYQTNPDFLPAEYFVLHQPKAVLSGRGGDNLSAYTKDLARLGNQGMARKGFSALPGHDPYSRQDWTDYADANKAPWQYTAKEIADATEAMAHHNDQLYNKSASEGGPFNLMKEAGVTTPKAKGGKFYWKDSPYTGQLNAAQNMLYHNTQGEKNFKDAGYDENTAIRDSMRFQKKKKKGFMGGLGKVLSPVAKIASFIPGPWQLPAQLYNAVQGFATGNPLGGLASLAGANFGVAGAPTSGAMAGSLAGKAASSIGGNIGSALVSGGLGAMQGASSGNALKGALTGAIGSGVGSVKADAIAKLSDSIGKLPAQALVNAGIGAGQGAINGDAALGAIIGGMGPLVNAGLGEAGLGKAGSAFGTGVAQGTVQTKANLNKQKKAIAKAIAQRNRGVA